MTQETALQIMKMGKNVFLTGAPGTGKTYVLNQYINYLKDHGIPVAITASTGIAASHIGGMTVHSFFGVGIKEQLTQYDIENLAEKKYLWDRMNTLKVLVIDEISMISPKLLNSLDQLLRTFKFSQKPFGGIQVILVGDFFQLPPVSKQKQEERFCFQSTAWEELSPAVCYLNSSYRHKEDTSLENILDEIRTCSLSENSLECFRSRWKKHPEGLSQITKLYTHNVDVEQLNHTELENLDTPLKIYDALTHGTKKLVERIFSSSLVSEKLFLKKGSLVCFIKNNYDKGYINGTLGIVVDFDVSQIPIVETLDGKTIKAQRMEWSFEDGEGKIKARVEQIPLRLAWALTIHKSQGMTLDAAEIDLSKAFEPGQGYVALSRVQKLSGLKLMGFNTKALEVDKNVFQADTAMRKNGIHEEEQILHLSQADKEEKYRRHITQLGGSLDKSSQNKSSSQKKSSYQKSQELFEKKYSIEDIAKERKISEETVIHHLKKILVDIPDFDISYLQPDSHIIGSIERAQKIIHIRNNPDDFLANGNISLKSLFKELNEKISYEEIKRGLLFLD